MPSLNVSFPSPIFLFFFFFNDTATTEIYTLSLHDALPICRRKRSPAWSRPDTPCGPWTADRKSTRLNSSHSSISYAVFCLKKKKTPHTSHHEHYEKTTTIIHHQYAQRP